MNPSILIITEQINGDIAPITYELIAAARTLRAPTAPDTRIKMILPVPSVSDQLRDLALRLGIDIIAITTDDRTMASEQVFKQLPASLLKDLNPAFICMAHNTNGLDAAPGIAVKLDTACITGVEKITRKDDGLCFTRSLLGDRITADIQSCVSTTVLTIVSGCFEPAFECDDGTGTVSAIDLPDPLYEYELIEFDKNTSDTSGIDEADVIVSAGNGIREKEDLDLVYELAALFPKSAVAGSRPICDKKWLQYGQQVGITGATVKPKLYIACGISGASQHISGMRESKFIVSINTDPHAAIFNISDVCINEDVTAFIPQIISLFNDK